MYHQNRANRSTLNEAYVSITNITNPSNAPSDSGVWSSLRTNNNLIFAVRNSFGSEILFPHHVTCAGGSIEDPAIQHMCLFDYSDQAQPMKLQDSLMAGKANTFVPSWEDMQNVDKAESFNALKATEDEKLHYLQIIALPPFVAYALLNY